MVARAGKGRVAAGFAPMAIEQALLFRWLLELLVRQLHNGCLTSKAAAKILQSNEII